MNKIAKKHPLAIRWLHWINFPLLFLMIWSGLLIYWANDVYGVRLFGHELFHFFPARFYKALGIPSRLAEGMAWHFLCAWFFALNGVLYVLYTAFSGEWRHLLPHRESFKEAFQVLLYDLHLSKYHPPPRKFNGAQQIAYTSVILMGAGSLATGLAVYKPTQFAWLTTLIGGYEWARWEHFWLTIGYLAFFVIHVAQVVKAGWNNFRAMVTGYEIAPATEISPPALTPDESVRPEGATT